MSGLDRFKQWAELARLEQAPQPDVASAVLRRLQRSALLPESPTTGMWAFAIASACAAAACAFWGHDAWLALLGNWYSSIQDFASWSLI